MNSFVTITHPLYPDLICKLAPPSEEAYAAAFDAVATNKSKSAGILIAGYNLIVACAQGISQAEIPTLIADWPALPERAFLEVDGLAGGLRFEGPGMDDEEVNAWRFDLAKTVEAAREIADLRAKKTAVAAKAAASNEYAVGGASATADDARLAELLAKHTTDLEGLASSGLDLESCATLLARFNRRGQLTAIRTRDFGVLIIRRPGFQEQLAFASNSTSQGNYGACKLLALACTEHPVNGAIAPRLASSPSLTTSIAQKARGMVSEGMGGEVKKG